jgi:WD40 repeat protein
MENQDCGESATTNVPPANPLLAMCSIGDSSLVLGFDSGSLRHITCEASQLTSSSWQHEHAHKRSVSALCSTGTTVDSINADPPDANATQIAGHIFSGSRDCSLACWDARTGALQWRKEEAHEMTVSAVAMHDNVLASGSRDTTVKVWDASQGTCIAQRRVARNIVTCMTFQNGNSDILYQAGEDLQVRILDVRASRAGQALVSTRSLAPFTYFALCIDSHVGTTGTQKVVTGTKGFEGVGCSVILWDVGTGKPIWTGAGHQQDVVGCAFVNSGAAIVSVSKDGGVRLWNTSTGACLDDGLVGTGYSDQAVGLSRMNLYAATDSVVSVATFGGGVTTIRCLAIGKLEIDVRRSSSTEVIAVTNRIGSRISSS